jgi:putative MFS transporter
MNVPSANAQVPSPILYMQNGMETDPEEEVSQLLQNDLPIPITTTTTTTIISMPMKEYYSIIFALGLCNSVDAIETNAFASILVSYKLPSTKKRLDEDPILSGIATSSVFIGMLLGGIGSGFLADDAKNFGKRKTLLLCMFINGLCAFFSALCSRMETDEQINWLILFRFCSGFGIGGSLPCAFALLAEFSPIENRGFHMSLLNASWTIGAIFITTLAWLVLDPVDNTEQWPIFVFICAFPPFLALFAVLKFVKHKSIRTSVVVIDESGDNQQEQTKIFTRPLGTFAMIWLTLSFGSYGTTTWIADVFAELGYSDPLAVGLMFAIASVPGTILATLLIERIGRKSLLCTGMFFSGFSAFAFTMFVNRGERNTGLVIGSACLFSVFVTFSWVGLGVMSSEEYPLKIRTTSMGISAAFGRIGSILANLVNPFLLRSHSILTVAGIVLCIGGVIGMISLVDRSQKSLDR